MVDAERDRGGGRGVRGRGDGGAGRGGGNTEGAGVPPFGGVVGVFGEGQGGGLDVCAKGC